MVEYCFEKNKSITQQASIVKSVFKIVDGSSK